jgi:hypothetical protein
VETPTARGLATWLERRVATVLGTPLPGILHQTSVIDELIAFFLEGAGPSVENVRSTDAWGRTLPRFAARGIVQVGDAYLALCSIRRYRGLFPWIENAFMTFYGTDTMEPIKSYVLIQSNGDNAEPEDEGGFTYTFTSAMSFEQNLEYFFIAATAPSVEARYNTANPPPEIYMEQQMQEYLHRHSSSNDSSGHS